MKNLNKQLTTYYRNIQHHLPCNRKVKKKIIDRIKGTINIYFQENPTTDFNSIQLRYHDLEFSLVCRIQNSHQKR